MSAIHAAFARELRARFAHAAVGDKGMIARAATFIESITDIETELARSKRLVLALQRREPRHLCPECVQGKHSNCVEQTLDDNDQWVPCGCPEHEGTT